MIKYKNRKELLKATDEEIEHFFAETTFEGIYSSEIRSKNTDFYKGSISNIKLEGRPTNIVPTFLNVPISSKPIPEGPCSFKCRFNLAAYKQDTTKYIVNILGSTLTAIDSIFQPEIMVSSKDSKEQDLFEMWGVDNCECIGFYHYDEESETYIVDDLRKPNFDHIPYYPGDTEKRPIKITYPHEIRGIKLNDYYLFTWKLSHRNKFNPYEIYIDFENQPKPIEPKWFIDTLFDDRHNDKSKNFGSATNFLDTLSKQLSAKESTFVYELLQNANDYPVEGQSVDVEFYVTDNYILFIHSGDKFNVRNISGICGINEKEKVSNKKTIGYKGIGFKTVFLNNHYVYLRTGKYSFRFDQKAKKIKRLEAPWPILPVWTSHEEVAAEVNSVFDTVDKKFRVQIALRPDDKNMLHLGRNSYANLFKEVFADSNIILFIPNINSVRVIIDGKEERICFRNNDEWIVGDYEEDIEPNIQALVNKTIDKGNSRIPEKYKDFDCTKVSFACKHEGAIIKPVDKATLYCYLPTKASWGFPFLMNTDMIPKGDRNDIETEVKLLDEDGTNFNEVLAAIAGRKLFDWLKNLLMSRKYHLGSVFSLVPDFKKCKKEHDYYDDFIAQFENEFNECVETEQIVPVTKGIANVKSVVYDTIGLTTAGVMTDDDFLKFSGLDNGYLPLPLLRKDKNFLSFLKRYADEDMKFNEDKFHDMMDNEDFQTWLKVQDNNNKFIKFLLDNDMLEDFMDEEIFLEDEGSLQKAEVLYYDVDKYLVDLQAFTNYIYFLSPKTREFFKDNEKWNEAIDEKFAEFNCDDFVNNELLSRAHKASTIESLKDKDTSVHFFKFLAENVTFDDEFTSLPFIADDETVVDDFEDKFLFFTSEKGHKVCESEWMSSIPVAFISSDYTKTTKDYLKENFGVQVFSDEIIIKDIILSGDYHDKINTSQQEDKDTSVAFVKYCFEHETLFDSGSLRNYALNSYDCDGAETFVLYEDHIFFPSECFDQYSQKKWLNCDWMYSLDSDYLKVDNDKEKVKVFLKKAFYAEELDTDKFYKDIVRPNISSIISNTSGSNDGDGAKNLDFICYLDANYNLVFDKEKDADRFESFVFIGDSDGNGFYDIASDSAYIYAYNSELKDILDSEWFPADTVNMCTSKYGESKSIQAIKAKKYDFTNFFNDVITEKLDNINDTISSKDASVAFHTFIIDRLADLTDKQKEVMKGAKVYLFGNDDASDRSDGHHILSKSARELVSMGLVEFSDLDIIDPDYHIEENEDYWKTRLGNEQFTVTDFITWLTNAPNTFYSTIEDKDNNIKFWRWVKECKLADQTLANLPVLPVYLTTDEYVDSDDTIYLSDDYIEEGGLETIVKSYHPNPSFISSEYVEENDNIANWKDFWVKMGVRFEMIDILIDTIDNRLSDTDDAKLPATIAKYRLKLEEHYDGNLIPNLRNLRVKAHDGEFYSLLEVIYVDSEKEEPFKYIDIPIQVSFATADERKLIIDILDEIDGDKITKLTEWKKVKIERYLEIQGDENNEDLLRSIHFRFVDELAAMYIADKDSLKEFDQISNVLFLNSNDEFTDVSEMTEGSLYKPFCDFEKYGLDYDYISNSYLQECTNDIRKMLNRVFKIHCDFGKDDIENLSDRDFSIYFWSQYLIKRDADISGIKKLIEDREFESIACIPTKDYMKKPGEIYSLTISSYVIKHVNDWENKLPLKDLPNIEYDKEEKRTLFGLLLNKPSNLRLSFCDSLYALFSIAGHERRTQLLQWMIETYDEKYDVNVTEYRADESAKWKNTKNEDKPITELYALSYNDKKLEQYFGNLPQIINKDYLPAGSISFKNACDILQITTIEPEDLIVDKIDQVSKNEVYKKTLKLYALVLAGYEDAENWSSRYQKYCELIDTLELWCCTAISIRYEKDENIHQNLKKFYREKDSADFYFVKSLDEKRVFKPFVENFIEYLGIEADKDFVETVMDSCESAMELVQENNTLMLDEPFKDELDLLIPGIKRKLTGNEADDTDCVDEDKRHTFSGHTADSDDETSDEDYEDNKSSSSEEEYPDNGTEYPRGVDYDDDNVDDTKKNRSDKWATHDYPTIREPHERKSSLNTPPTRVGEGTRSYSDMNGWEGSGNNYTPKAPKPYSPEDVRNFGSHGVTRTLEVLEPTTSEVAEINRIIGEDLSSEQVADQNYLVQLRLYNNLVNRGMTPNESKDDFVRNAHMKNEHTVTGGKYIHKCSAAGGIMYLSPSIWNKIADDRCVVCVYLGAKSNEFMYFNSIDDILKWIGEDDIVIKLTGEEKADVVEELYSGVLNGVKGTAYTLIRINSNEKYNSLFAQLPTNYDINETEENEDEYGD